MEGVTAAEELSPSPVRRLDLDTLTAIFHEVVREPENSQEAFKRLICLTHICHKWRVLGLGLAELWGDVAFVKAKNSEMFNILLSRAQNAPLSHPYPPAYPHSTNGAFEEQIDYTLSHVERFRRLWHTDLGGYDWAAVLLAKTFPSLESITLVCHRVSLNLMQAPIRAPVLCSLYLTGFFVPFEAPRLVSLRIRTQSLPVLTFDNSYLREVLLSVPNLVELGLDGCLPIGIQAGDATSPIALSRLRFISLGGPSLSLWTLLRQLRLGNPESVMIHLELGGLADDADAEHLTNALKPYLGGSSRNTVCIEPDGSSFFKACRLHSLDAQQEALGPILLTLHDPSNFETQWMFSDLYERLCRQFYAGQIEHLEITISPKTSHYKRLSLVNATALLVPQLANSVHTVLYHIDTSEFPEQAPMDFDLVPRCLQWNQETPVYPKLERLILRGSETMYASAVTANRALVELKGWLEYRIQLGKPLRTLTLQGEAYSSGLAPDPARLADDVAAWSPIRQIVDVVDERKLPAHSLGVE
ncbi:hypothetical protein PENSPDRAFT_758084 [Peniophora sp. CONT]|nr:hypothetical protein PENSPDRAFT_758084 [Peniophora sp. CONT]